MSKQCIAMTLFLCESSVFSSRIRRRKREESGWVNNYTWRRVLQSALYNKLATICVSLLWRTFENKNSTAIYQPYTINVFLNWLHHVCYDTVGFLHFTTSFCSSLLCIWKGEKFRATKAKHTEMEMIVRLFCIHWRWEEQLLKLTIFKYHAKWDAFGLFSWDD